MLRVYDDIKCQEMMEAIEGVRMEAIKQE